MRKLLVEMSSLFKSTLIGHDEDASPEETAGGEGEEEAGGGEGQEQVLVTKYLFFRSFLGLSGGLPLCPEILQ